MDKGESFQSFRGNYAERIRGNNYVGKNLRVGDVSSVFEADLEHLGSGNGVVSRRLSWVMATLYLRGMRQGVKRQVREGDERRLNERKWPLVREVVMLGMGAHEIGEALRRAGLWEEASVWGDLELRELAFELQQAGHVVAIGDRIYPGRWVEALGSLAPPAVWCEGRVPIGASSGNGVAVVGMRDITREESRIALRIGAGVTELGRVVISGGARGVDESACLGAGSERSVLVLPCGLEEGEAFVGRGRREGECWLSVAEPKSRFAAGLAMERNRLLYAIGRHAIVVKSRLRAGGTWRGATDALRRGLTTLLVREDGSAAARGLLALGGVGLKWDLDCVDGLDRLEAGLSIEAEGRQMQLFGGREVREGVGSLLSQRELAWAESMGVV